MTQHSIMVVTSEASGDALGADLVARVACRAGKFPPNWYGMAGPLMRQAGVEAVISSESMAVMGLWEVLCHWRTVWSVMRRLKRLMRDRRPDGLVLIDSPAMNIRLARYAKRLGIRVFYYVSPKVWVWKAKRLDVLANCVDHMAVLFAFEKKLYEKKHVPVSYVGHYLSDTLRDFVQPHPIVSNPSHRRIAILPGSRAFELEYLTPLLLAVIRLLHQSYPDLRFVWVQAPFLPADVFNTIQDDHEDLPIEWVKDDHRAALSRCDLALACSGTITFELGVLGIPTIVMYRMAALSFWVAKRLVKVRWVSLVNLIARQAIFTELLQGDLTVSAVVRSVQKYLDDQAYYQSKIRALATFQGALDADREDVSAVLWAQLNHDAG